MPSHRSQPQPKKGELGGVGNSIILGKLTITV